MQASAEQVYWLSVVGARPQFIKVAPLAAAIRTHNAAGLLPAIRHTIVHTGQHYDHDMAQLFFVELGIPEPNFNLEVGSLPHGEQLARMMQRLDPLLQRERPDWVIVYGDTNSTLAAALTAARQLLPLAHVEAGCRSYNREMPEEQNRVVADHLSWLLLPPSQNALDALHREGIGTSDDPLRRKSVIVGDVMFDALLANLKVAEQRTEERLARLQVQRGKYYLLTLHRAENTDDVGRLQSLLEALEQVDYPVLFPVHPRTRKLLGDANAALEYSNVRLVSPLGYLDMLVAEKYARKILTDSGGVQKEALYVRVPCVTLREQTEWPETVDVGANRLTGMDPQRVLEALGAPAPDFSRIPNLFGDGHTSQAIMRELLSHSGVSGLCTSSSWIGRQEPSSQLSGRAAS